MPNPTFDHTLLAILACWDTHRAPLRLSADGGSLTCTGCGRVYPIANGIPVLLPEQARRDGDGRA